MGVKSARVQQGVVGDLITFSHTIVKPAVVGNIEGAALVTVNTGDSVKALYESKQPDNDLDPAVPPVESAVVPGTGASTYNFVIAAVDSAKLLAGNARTVRLEVTRAGGALETYYLFDEYDLLDRGFPSEATQLNLP